jgi:hypothetical protein
MQQSTQGARWAHVPLLLGAAAMAAPWGGGIAGSGFGGTEAARLVLTSIHEGGHAAVGRAFGLEVEVTLSAPGTGLCKLFEGIHQPPQVQRLIALAGPCAAAVAEFGLLRATAGWLHSELASGRIPLSGGDAALAGHFRLADVSTAMDLVRQRWRVVSLIASHAIEDYLKVTHAHA